VKITTRNRFLLLLAAIPLVSAANELPVNRAELPPPCSREEVIALKDFGRGHSTRTLLFDAQREKLYVGIGSRSNIDAGEHPMRAAIHLPNARQYELSKHVFDQVYC